MPSLKALFILVIAMLFLAAAGPAQAENAHDFVFETPAGEEIALSEYAGRPVLLAISDSYCGLTNQYSDLQTVWERYREDGLMVLGVPTNAFVTPQSMSPEEFVRYCRRMIGITFPLASTVAIRGEDAHPFFNWLEAEAGAEALPRLPFNKYLIGADGDLLGWFPPASDPNAAAIREAVESALASSKAAS